MYRILELKRRFNHLIDFESGTKLGTCYQKMSQVQAPWIKVSCGFHITVGSFLSVGLLTRGHLQKNRQTYLTILVADSELTQHVVSS